MMTWWIVAGLLAVLLLLAIFLYNPFAMPLREDLEKYVRNLHPSIRSKYRSFIRDIERKGYKAEIASCHRGWEKSLYMWQTMPEVQACCQPGKDYHYMGMACDIVIYTPSGQRLGNASSRADWEATGIPQLAQQKYGLQWGGQPGFSYWDPVHFAWAKYPMTELVKRTEETCGSLAGDCGNKISLTGLTTRT